MLAWSLFSLFSGLLLVAFFTIYDMLLFDTEFVAAYESRSPLRAVGITAAVTLASWWLIPRWVDHFSKRATE